MQALLPLLGVEHPVDEVARQLASWARFEGHPIVGAVGINCADETEREVTEAFQRGFVDYLLPRLKIAQQAPFRLTNLGARYEPGAVSIAEDHFAVGSDEPKLLVVKINSHVGVSGDDREPSFGFVDRYGRRSVACGALAALLDGHRHRPFLRELADCLLQQGVDPGRMAELATPHRPLLAAAASCLAQAHRALTGIRDHNPRTPTDYLVVAAVTLNRALRDGEIVCGLFWLERREGDEERREIAALPADPAQYRVDLKPDGRVLLSAST